MAASGAAIAAAASRYEGRGYVYGGTGSRPGDWDCSSFISYVLGHDLRLGLPGGTWERVTQGGTIHGPVVVTYASWSGAATIHRADARAGDLVAWVGQGTGGHIGVVLGVDEMVSALDTAQGTVRTPIDGYGPPGAPMVFRRVRAAATGPLPAAPAGHGTSWGSFLLAAALGLLVGGGAVVVVVGGAALVAVAAVWLAGKGAREMMG